MPLYLWEKIKACPEDEIEKFEEARCIRLPPLLRNFLLTHDGGEANEDQSRIETRSPACPIPDLQPARVLGIKANSDGAATIPEVTEELGELIPRSGIPFAEDVFGAYLVVDSDTEEIDFVNLDPSEHYVGVGCFPTGLYLKDIMAEVLDGQR